MVGGIKSLQNGDFCAYCEAKVNLNAYNFCPKCGNPLSQNAMKLRDQQEKRIKLEILDELAEEVNDTKTLAIIVNKIKNI